MVLSMDRSKRALAIDGSAPRTFNTTKRAFSSSNINFYNVFYPALTFLIFFLLVLMIVGLVECCCHSRSFSILVDVRLVLSTDNTRAENKS